MNARKLLAIAGCAVALGAGASAQTVLINGAGRDVSVPDLLEVVFASTTSCIRTVQINYQSIGSGGGIRQVTNQTVFFGATDGPMTNDQLLAAPSKILHFPTVLGAVVPVYNIPGVTAELKFTGPVLADIFLGKITKWNDPQIAKLNPGVTLPVADITVVHRSDGSGTTYIWVDYLAKVSRRVEDQGRRGHLGELADRRRRQGQRGRGRPGDADARVDRLRRADLRAAEQDQLRIGAEHGGRVRARVRAGRDTAAAAAAAGKMPADFRVSITNAEGKGVYPISSFTWLLLYESPKDKAQVEDDGRLREVGVDGRPEVLRRARLRAAARASVVKLEMAALAKIKVS